jgi:GT2 family glycosyltransferase
MGDLEGQIPPSDKGSGTVKIAPQSLRLSILIVDNASDPPLEGRIAPAQGLDVEFLRLPRNLGGSGGFNAGLHHALARGIPGDACELLWLLDSDVRLAPDALFHLIEALDSDPGLAAVGSALVDPRSRKVFELGGRVNPRTGEYTQDLPANWQQRQVVPAEYIAACSLLVRRPAAERTGLMADLFLNGDDVEWGYRLGRLAGGRLGVATRSRAIHPQPDRMRTGARYYAARNAFTAIDCAAQGRPGQPPWNPRRARFIRALRETGRAIAQALVGRADLGELHLRGLRDALRGVQGPAPADALNFEPARPIELLPDTLKEIFATRPRGKLLVRPGILPEPASTMRLLNSLCIEPHVKQADPESLPRLGLHVLRRLILGCTYGVAIVSARGYPHDWAIARTIITVADGGFVARRIRRTALLMQAASMAARGLCSAMALRRSCPDRNAAPPPIRSGPKPTTSTIILSYNRCAVLRTTLTRIYADPSLRPGQVIIADNASADGSAQQVRANFPTARVLELNDNAGIAAFNRAAKLATADVLLILDDDAWPDAGAIDQALDVLARRPDIGAVALHPRHPHTSSSEWPFAEKLGAQEHWPFMGCGNLVRREAWERVGGYEEGFFLYRNDTDLALKLLATGYRVYFDPALIVWHDSPAAGKKSLRWFELATRNWIWMCRRHGRGITRAASIALGWAWAHRLAGLQPLAHLRILRGAWAGLFRPAPPFAAPCKPLGRLLRLRLRR